MYNRISVYSPPYSAIESYVHMAEAAKKFGLGAVEGFSRFEFSVPDTSKALAIREHYDKEGITVPCFSVFADVSKTDYDETLSRLKAYADVAKTLGSPFIHHTIVGEVRNPELVLPYRKELFDKGIRLVRDVYDYAESIGIKAVYEPQGYIFNGHDGFSEFLSCVNRDVGVVADLGNIFQAGGNAIRFVKDNIDRILHVHVKDVCIQPDPELGIKTLSGGYMTAVQCGEGIADVADCIKLIENSGYKGYYAIEQKAFDDDAESYKSVIEMIDGVIS